MREFDKTMLQEFLAPFDIAEVRVRTIPYTASYVTARVVMTRLDDVLPYQWEFHLKGEGRTDAGGVLHQDGFLRITDKDGRPLEYHDRGSAPPDAGKGQAKQAKHAVSDCFKRCAVHLGIARYLYELPSDYVKATGIHKDGIEKALAAVGWRGDIEAKHFGKIGGIREADLEDEDDHSSISTPEPTPRPAPAATPPTQQRPTQAPATNSKYAPQDKVDAFIAAVEANGGSVEKPTFISWLKKNTANQAASLDAVLAEDIDELLQRFDALINNKKPATQPTLGDLGEGPAERSDAYKHHPS